MNNKIKKLLASLLATTIFATTVGFTNINTTEKEQNSSTEITTITTDEEQTPEKEKTLTNKDNTIAIEEIKPPTTEETDNQPNKPTEEKTNEELDLSNAKLFDVETNEYVDISNLSLVENENMIMPLLEPNYTHYVYNGSQLRLDIGKALFGYHQTNEFYVYQGLQKTVGYCFQSHKSNPSEGSYPAIDINNIAPVWKRVIGRILQYAPGTLGYANNRVKIQSWFDNKLPYNYPINGTSKEETDYIMCHIALSIAYAQGDTSVASKWGNPWVSIANEWLYYIDSTAGRQEYPDNCPYTGYSYRPMILQTGNNITQDIGFLVLKPNDGYLKLKKSSSDTSLTDKNDCYSLKGAEYGVYSNQTCTNKVATLITNENGDTNTVKLPTGTYYYKEEKAPKGYELDKTVRNVTITTNHTSTSPALVNVKDIPKMDPVEIILKKVDSKTKLNNASVKTASLKGAEFEFMFYKGIYQTDPALSGQQPVRKWVFRTDDNGYIKYSKEYLVSGDELYYSQNDIPSLPIGTVTIKEIKSPEGFLINDELSIVNISQDETTGDIISYIEPVIPENLFSLNLIKKQADKEVVIPNAVFEHICPDGEIDEYTTDENGKLKIEGLQWGVHIIKEKTAPTGYLKNTAQIKFRVNEDNSIEILSNTSTDETGNITLEVLSDSNLSMIVEDKVIPPSLKIIKENDKQELLQGAEFTLYSDKQCTQVVDKSISNEQGEIQFKNIDIDRDYYLMETDAPNGYKLPTDKDGNFIKYKIRFESIPAQNTFNFIVNDKVYNNNTSDDMYYVENNTGAIKVINTLGVQLPKTGSNTANIIFILSTSIMLTALILIDKRSVKNDR